MSIRIAAVLSFALVAATASPGAWAKSTIQSECGAEYQTAKAANTLGGKKWPEFLSECKTRRAAATSGTSGTSNAGSAASSAPTTTMVPPPVTAQTQAGRMSPDAKTPDTDVKKPVSGGRKAMLERQRTCGGEWKAQKADLVKATPGLKWPQYWSACNKRLKGEA